MGFGWDSYVFALIPWSSCIFSYAIAFDGIGKDSILVIDLSLHIGGGWFVFMQETIGTVWGPCICIFMHILCF